MAQVVITAEAQRQFHELPIAVQARIEKVLARLAKWPAVSGVKALSGKLAGHFRIRTGDYRVQFRATGKTTADIVTVERVGHRDGFYED